MFVDQVKVDGFHAVDIFVTLLFGQGEAENLQRVVQPAFALVQAFQGLEALGLEIFVHGLVLLGTLYV